MMFCFLFYLENTVIPVVLRIGGNSRYMYYVGVNHGIPDSFCNFQRPSSAFQHFRPVWMSFFQFASGTITMVSKSQDLGLFPFQAAKNGMGFYYTYTKWDGSARDVFFFHGLG